MFISRFGLVQKHFLTSINKFCFRLKKVVRLLEFEDEQQGEENEKQNKVEAENKKDEDKDDEDDIVIIIL